MPCSISAAARAYERVRSPWSISTPRGPIISDTTPAGDHAHCRHLAEPQMRVHEAERERRVAVVVGFDEGNLPLAPVDHHAPLKRQAARGERCQTLGDVLLLRQGGEQRATGHDEGCRADGESDGEGGEKGGHAVLQAAACSNYGYAAKRERARAEPLRGRVRSGPALARDRGAGASVALSLSYGRACGGACVTSIPPRVPGAGHASAPRPRRPAR